MMQQTSSSPSSDATSSNNTRGMQNVAGDYHTIQTNQYMNYIASLNSQLIRDDMKLKAVQEISNNLEVIIQSPHYSTVLDHMIKAFVKVLEDGEPQFIAEFNGQQMRKLILEIFSRLPLNEYFQPYVRTILSILNKLLEIDNETNVLICFKFFIELYKHYKPQFISEIIIFLKCTKLIFANIPSNVGKIFAQNKQIKVKDLSEINVQELLNETVSTLTIQIEKRNDDNSIATYYMIPKSVLSLKIQQELIPIILLLYQHHRQCIHQDISDFIPLMIHIIALRSTALEQNQINIINKEIYVDFVTLQIKTLSFLANVSKSFMEIIKIDGEILVEGILNILSTCPMEVTQLRKELILDFKLILGTDLKEYFTPHVKRLIGEEILIGRGWTTYEALRPLAYSTLADLVHNVRHKLPFADLKLAVNLYSRNVHDDTLQIPIQIGSCRILLNLVDCIRLRSENENSNEGRKVLMRMLEVFVLKFKAIAKIKLPIMKNYYEEKKQEQLQLQENNTAEAKTETTDPTTTFDHTLTLEKETKFKFGYRNPTNYNLTDYRNLLKTLVCGVKTITWGCCACKTSANQTLNQTKHFQSHERIVFVKLVKWALKAIDIYTLNNYNHNTTSYQMQMNQALKCKEEKELLEQLSGVFSIMNSQTFQEIFTITIEYLVQRIYENPNLRTVPSTLLAHPSTSPYFATVLVEYLLGRMEEMGSNLEKSDHYLRLFKLIFGSVTLFPQENENMLRPYLPQIVNKCIKLATTAAEPFNYFMVLRGLFRSIGGGSHDLLYQEFLPLLPNLLLVLNRFQSGFHKREMKDLLVELCLTVPVRLSSLLPYLPLLMDPLVSALNGPQHLINQGLRTLELFVENLHYDFLNADIQRVRAELIQSLWQILSYDDEVAQVAMKVLGKLGGGNRNILNEPQKLHFSTAEFDPPAIQIKFNNYQQWIILPVDKVIETAFNTLKQNHIDTFYRIQAWKVINCYLKASLNFQDSKNDLIRYFLNPSFEDVDTIPNVKGIDYKCVDHLARETHQMALKGMIVGSAIKDLSQQAMKTLMLLVRHYTMVAVAQQCGKFAHSPEPNTQVDLDPLVLVDALTDIMGHEERELCKPGKVALVLIVDTATTLLGSKDTACQLPLIEYLSEKMCSLCYERAWYAKLGGCMAINFMVEKCALKWLYKHVLIFLKALRFVMMDLTEEISSGALDMAKETLQKMLTTLITIPEAVDEDTLHLRTETIREVTQELVYDITNGHTIVRKQSMEGIRLLANEQNETITTILGPFKDILAQMSPLKKTSLKEQSLDAQIGIMDGNTFFMNLEPCLFRIDMNIKEHALFINDLCTLGEMDDQHLCSFPCYKLVTDFSPLQQNAMRVLASCYYLDEKRDKIFQILYKHLKKSNALLQQTAFECLEQFISSGFKPDDEFFHTTVRPVLMSLDDTESVQLDILKVISYLAQLFPTVFEENHCKQLLNVADIVLSNAIQNFEVTIETAARGNLVQKLNDERKIITIIKCFCYIPVVPNKFIIRLVQIVLQIEQALAIEISGPFTPALTTFLLTYPIDAVNMLLDNNYVQEQLYSRFLEYIIKHKDGKPFRDYIQKCMVDRLMEMLQTNYVYTTLGVSFDDTNNKFQFQSIRIISLLIKYDDQWLSTQPKLVEVLKEIWCDDAYQKKHTKNGEFEDSHWNEPKLLVKILLHYFCHHPQDIDLLFQLLRATIGRFIPEFQFLKDFLENIVAQNYTIDWKRSAFFRFVEIFSVNEISQELKAKILHYILIPSFDISLERGEMNKLILGSSKENNQNVVSVFMSQLIDPECLQNTADCVRISLLQMAALLVDKAWPHIYDYDSHHVASYGDNKTQQNTLKRLLTFAWPSLIVENCVDPLTRYHGHLLISHIIVKFAIRSKLVLQVFYSLLKAHTMEGRNVVQQALDILTPVMPLRIENAHDIIAHWTKKILADEGHNIQQLLHILQLIVKHYKIYYPIRHELMDQMINSIQKFGCSAFEHKKMAVELAEVIIKWELNEILETEKNKTEVSAASPVPNAASITLKRPLQDGGESSSTKAIIIASTSGGKLVPIPCKVENITTQEHIAERKHIINVIHALLRLACQINDASVNVNASNQTLNNNPSEILSRRCVILLKSIFNCEKLIPKSIDLKIGFLDKILLMVDVPNANIFNVCTALDLLTFLLTVYNDKDILLAFSTIQDGLLACIVSLKGKVINLMHTLLVKLVAIVPLNQMTNCEPLKKLYTKINDIILDGLNSFEQKRSVHVLYGCLMMLKAVCTSNTSYVDALIIPFAKTLQCLLLLNTRSNNKETITSTGELLILSFDLLKMRVGMLGSDVRSNLLNNIITELIKKSTDAKLMKAIVQMIDDWLKATESNQVPNHQEISLLLVALMQNVEKHFPNDYELHAQFFELVVYIYDDDCLKKTELVKKLESVFLAGLRFTQPKIRKKFLDSFNSVMDRNIFDRLLYIFCSQNWERFGPNYWIKQALGLLLATTVPELSVKMKQKSCILPAIIPPIANQSNEIEEHVESNQEMIKELIVPLIDCIKKESPSIEDNPDSRTQSITRMINTYYELIEESNQTSSHDFTTEQFISSTAELCHLNTALAEQIWLNLFPRLWTMLQLEEGNGKLQQLCEEIIPFITFGVNVFQKDFQPSAMNTFVEALFRCSPKIKFPPALMKYLATGHNLWHRIIFEMENQISMNPGSEIYVNVENVDIDEKLETVEFLSDLYYKMSEVDMWSSLWRQHAHYKETASAIAFQQHGFYEQAQETYINALAYVKADTSLGPIPASHQRESNLISSQYTQCARELQMWDLLVDYCKQTTTDNKYLLLESAWKTTDWDLMKTALSNIEFDCPKELAWKVTLYGGFLIIGQSDNGQSLMLVEKHIEKAILLCLNEWRKHPRIVSHAHMQYLQGAQLIMELQDIYRIHKVLRQAHTISLHEIKSVVKTWKNRLPGIADSLIHWKDIFTWRLQNCQTMLDYYKNNNNSRSVSNLIKHSAAHSIIQFGKIARKHKLGSIGLESLKNFHTINSVPVIDCLKNLKEQVKCYIQMASISPNKMELEEGLNLINRTNVQYFSKEISAEYFALKGLVCHLSSKSNEANAAFTTAIQLSETLYKAWGLYGDYLENVFLTNSRQISFGENAIACFLHACQEQIEAKSRKYIAKVLWLLSYDNENKSLLAILEKYAPIVTLHLWLPWVPQLVNCLLQYQGNVILNLLCQIGRVYPQAIYLPVRLLYLTLRTITAARKTTVIHHHHQQQQQQQQLDSISETSSQSDHNTVNTSSFIQPNLIGNTSPLTTVMEHCCKIMKYQKDIHTTLITSLEAIADQMEWIKENWYEEVLRQLYQRLNKCYTLAFEQRECVNEAKTSQHILNTVKKLAATFGVGVENISSSANVTFNSAASESLARRAEAADQDPVFLEMKAEFNKDLDFSNGTETNSMQLHVLIFKLRKWIKILENRCRNSLQSFLIEEKCRLLSNFTLKYAEVALPGEFLLPNNNQYFVRINQFMPRVDLVQKHNAVVRRLHIRGHNGKIYPYLVVNDSGLADSRREERVLQMFRMMNLYLEKDKETAKRLLNFTVPKVVTISQQIRLVEDNPTSISYLDILKRYYTKIRGKSTAQHDQPIQQYYQHLAEIQSKCLKNDNDVYLDIFDNIRKQMIPKTILKQWALETFSCATDYWHFRKTFTSQLSLACFAEYVFNLIALNPDMMYLHQNSGMLSISYYKFDIDETTGELNQARSVPFRLTPNIAEYITTLEINGPLVASMIATARCLLHPNFKVINILKPILRDEMILSRGKKSVDECLDTQNQNLIPETEQVINKVLRAIISISNKLNHVANLEGRDSNAAKLVETAQAAENLCLMDPTWYPWL